MRIVRLNVGADWLRGGVFGVRGWCIWEGLGVFFFLILLRIRVYSDW